MNAKQMILAAVLIFTSAYCAQAQTTGPVLDHASAAKKDRIDMSYARALSFDNKGVVEAALAVVTKLKLDNPAVEFPRIMKEVSYLATHSDIPMVRYRACLAEAVFINPAQFQEAATRQYSDANAFFSALDERAAAPSLSSY